MKSFRERSLAVVIGFTSIVLCAFIFLTYRANFGTIIAPLTDGTPKTAAIGAVIDNVVSVTEDLELNTFDLETHIVEIYARFCKALGQIHIDSTILSDEDDQVGNYILRLKNGYFVSYSEKKATDVTERIDRIVELSDFLETQDINFVYVNQINRSTARYGMYPKGLKSNTDIVGDAISAAIEEAGIGCLDLYEQYENDLNCDYYSLFFKTDHHWIPKTGLWVAEKIAEYLNSNCGYFIDMSMFDSSKYEERVYEDTFLGTYGKNVTLGVASPDDFVAVLPNFETDFSVKVYRKLGEFERTGNFTECFFDDRLINKNYYKSFVYSSYFFGDNPLTVIKNNDVTDGHKILFLKKSGSNVVVPFLAQGIEFTDAIDPRHFEGDIEEYIIKSKPDTVVLMSNAESSMLN